MWRFFKFLSGCLPSLQICCTGKGLRLHFLDCMSLFKGKRYKFVFLNSVDSDQLIHLLWLIWIYTSWQKVLTSMCKMYCEQCKTIYILISLCRCRGWSGSKLCTDVNFYLFLWMVSYHPWTLERERWLEIAMLHKGDIHIVTIIYERKVCLRICW